MFGYSEPDHDSMLNQAATLKAQWEQEKQPEQPAPTSAPQPAARTNTVPKTGDESRIGLSLTLMALAALGLTALVWRRKEN